MVLLGYFKMKAGDFAGMAKGMPAHVWSDASCSYRPDCIASHSSQYTDFQTHRNH